MPGEHYPLSKHGDKWGNRKTKTKKINRPSEKPAKVREGTEGYEGPHSLA